MDSIPFIPSDNNYTLGVVLGGIRYLFVTYWNSRDASWYFDMYQEDLTPVALGVKIALGINLGRRSTHPFFKSHALRAIDYSNPSNAGVEAGFDDLGARVQVVHVDFSELLPGGGG